MKKIHNELFVVREFVSDTIERMDCFVKASKDLTTYTSFNESFSTHRLILETLKKELDKVTPWSFGWKKLNSIGHIMYCYYQTCRSDNVIGALDFAMHFTGYCDNIASIRQQQQKKRMNACSFSKKQTSFKKAYFPTIAHRTPIKNTYNLDKQILITGPNAAGKTTILKTTLFNVLLCQQIGCGFFKSAKIVPYDYIHCYINIPDTSGRDSLFQAEARRCKNILDSIRDSSDTDRHFCVFDELYSGTNPYEAIASAVSFLKYMNKRNNVSYIITTHFIDLCQRLSVENRVKNCHMATKDFGEDIKYTYKLKCGISSVRGGTKVLNDLQYPKEILDGAEVVIDNLNI
jgi:DNA mismatch repair ATPase MutS